MNSKEKILEKAKHLFHRYGVEQTSVDRILRDSNVTKSNFYYHFKGKNELALLVLKNRMKEYKEQVLIPTLDNDALTPIERLSGFYRKIIDYHQSMHCENGCPFGNIAVELSDTREEFRLELSRFFEEWRAKIENCLKEGTENKQFRADLDPGIISQFILSHLEGSILMVKTHKTIHPLESGTHAVLKLIKNNI